MSRMALKYLLIVYPECWNRICITRFRSLWPTVFRKIATCSSTDTCQVARGNPSLFNNSHNSRKTSFLIRSKSYEFRPWLLIMYWTNSWPDRDDSCTCFLFLIRFYLWSWSHNSKITIMDITANCINIIFIFLFITSELLHGKVTNIRT